MSRIIVDARLGQSTKQPCPAQFLESYYHIFSADANISTHEDVLVDKDGHMVLTGRSHDIMCHAGPELVPFRISDQVLDILRYYKKADQCITGIPLLQAILRTL